MPDWDTFVAGSPAGDHLQSSGWATTKAEHGLESARVVVRENGRIVAGAQMLIRRLPVIGRIGYVPRGPVVEDGDVARAAQVIHRLKGLVRSEGIRHLVVQPPRGGEWIAERLPSWGFVPSALAVAPTATALIDLSADVDQLFSAMSKSTRKHVRRSGQSGLLIREGGERDLPTFHRLLTASGARRGFDPYSLGYYQRMWEALRPAGHIGIFLAEYEGEALSAHLVVPFGEMFLSKVSAWSGTHAEVYPNEALEWHLIRLARATGYRFYDLEGFDRASAERLVAGGSSSTGDVRTVDAFKLKFGGRAVLLPKAFDFFPSALVGNTYGRIYRAAAADGWPRPAFARLRTSPGTKGAS